MKCYVVSGGTLHAFQTSEADGALLAEKRIC
jgi:uridylate kinase